MKKKIWVVSPVFYVMNFVMLGMALFSYQYNRIAFAVELTLTVLVFSSLFASDIILRKRAMSAIGKSREVLAAKDEISIDQFPIAIVVVGSQGDIIWGNELFRKQLAGGEIIAGNNIMNYIYPKTLRQIISERGTNINYHGKEFTVYGIRSDECHILYFVNDAEYKQIAREHKERHPVVCIAAFDNREEIARGGVGGEESRISANVDDVIRSWGNDEMGGFMRKLENGRYLIVTDDMHIEKAKKNRFDVIDRVREIKGESKMSATVSIGIGREAADMAESERWARQALDMALGRGGDQVAMKRKGDAFEFFGGLSKGVEKRDKVRTRVIAAAISDHAMNSDRIFIMGHKNSDLDCVGAAVGMWAAIRKGLKKQTNIVVRRNQTMAGHLVDQVEAEYNTEKVFMSPQDAIQGMTENTMLIVVDTHSVDFVESLELLQKAEKVVVIDHHRMMVSHIRDAVIFYHEPYASSAAEMVAELVQYIDSASLGAVDAQALLAGIMLDTKNFILKTGSRTFEAAAYLRRCGADTVEVKRLFSESLETYKEKARLVSEAEIYKDCAIAVSHWQNENLRLAAAQAADELLTIERVLASFVIYDSGGAVNISARSLGDVNVQLLLEVFGGGGHLTMAGAQVPGETTGAVRRMLIQVLDEKLDEVTAHDQ